MFAGSEVRFMVVNTLVKATLDNLADRLGNWENLHGDREPEKTEWRNEQTGWEWHANAPLRDMVHDGAPACCQDMVDNMWDDMHQAYVEQHSTKAQWTALVEDTDYRERQLRCKEIYEADAYPPGPPESTQLVLPGFMEVPYHETAAYRDGHLEQDADKAREWGYEYFDRGDAYVSYRIEVEYEGSGDVDDIVQITAGIDTGEHRVEWGHKIEFTIPLTKLRQTRLRAVEKLVMRMFCNA